MLSHTENQAGSKAAVFHDGSRLPKHMAEISTDHIGWGQLRGFGPSRDYFGWDLLGCLTKKSRQGAAAAAVLYDGCLVLKHTTGIVTTHIGLGQLQVFVP